MLSILRDDQHLILEYHSDGYSGLSWIDSRLNADGVVTIRKTFTFSKSSLFNSKEDEYANEDARFFILGTLDGDYYKISKNILKLKHDLLIARGIDITTKMFMANRDIPIFKRIDRLVNEQIVIGGDLAEAIPVADFSVLINNFPTTTELNRYADARVSSVLREFFSTMTDAQEKYNNSISRVNITVATKTIDNVIQYEIPKYTYIRDELRAMLAAERSYDEKTWQKKIASFLCLIFPKYLTVLESLQVKYHRAAGETVHRIIDFALVDSNGTIDIVEIKKPLTDSLLSRGKYRNNFIPKGELSGTVMQAEMYIYHLNKWGRDGEIDIQQRRKMELPEGLGIKITNPKALLILGRDVNFDSHQLFDFEIIKRKYSNVMDIMTYDDILRRLENIINMFSMRTRKTS